MSFTRLQVAACIAVVSLHARAGDALDMRDEEEACTPTERSVPLAVRAMDQLKGDPAAPQASVAVPALRIEGPRSRVAASFRSVVLPGLGQIYNGQTAKGGAILGIEVALLGSALAFHLSGSSAATAARETRATSPDPGGRAQQLADDAAGKFRVRDRLLLVGTGVWILNIADAFFNGGRPAVALPSVDGASGKPERGIAPLAAIRPRGAVVGLKGRF